jgi:hypothetical protein
MAQRYSVRVFLSDSEGTAGAVEEHTTLFSTQRFIGTHSGTEEQKNRVRHSDPDGYREKNLLVRQVA